MNQNSTFFMYIKNNPSVEKQVVDLLNNLAKDAHVTVYHEEDDSNISVDLTYNLKDEEDFIKLAKDVKAIAGTVEFAIEGFIATDEELGPQKDVEIANKNGKLTVSFSDWYHMIYMPNYKDCNEFRKDFPSYSDKDIEKFELEDYVYAIGELVYTEVPMHEVNI